MCALRVHLELGLTLSARLAASSRPNGAQSLEERLHEFALEQYGVGSGLIGSPVKPRVRVAGEGDQAELGMVESQLADGADAVEARHVQVDHDRVRLEPVDQLDRLEAVACGAYDGEL